MGRSPSGRECAGFSSPGLVPRATIPHMEPTTKTAIYLRISKDREGRALGVARQEELCRKEAARLGLSIVRVYSDNDISASRRSKKVRPEYRKMVAAVESGEIQAVLSYSLSRLTRNTRLIEDWIDLAEKLGVLVKTLKSGDYDLTTADGQMNARNKAAADSNYADRISEDVRAQKAEAREKGLYMGQPRAFGWNRRYEGTHPVEGPLVTAAARAVLGGASLASVVREWASVCSATPQGSAFTGTFARKVLLNPRHVPDLIPSDVAPGLYAILRDPSRRMAAKAAPHHLLSGLAVCGRCDGGRIVADGDTRRGPVYRCEHKHLYRQRPALDTYVSEQVLGYLRTVGARPGGGDRIGHREALVQRASALRAELDGLASLLVEKVLTVEGVRAASVRLRSELAQVEAQLADAASTALEGIPAGDDALVAWWRDLGTEGRREVIRALGVHIIVWPPRRGPAQPINEGYRDVSLFWSARERDEQMSRIRSVLG